MADSAVKIPFIEAAAPSTPAANRVVIYCKSDGLMYSKDDAGTETLMSAGGGGIPATIFDAKGDIIAATAADTASRLAVGANDLVLTAASGQTTGLIWQVPLPSKATSDASGNTGTLTADTETDMPGCSISLVTGNWLIGGTAIASAGTAVYILAVITDASNNHISMGRGVRQTGTPVSLPIPVRLVSPGSTTTYKLRVQAGASSGTFDRYATGTTPGTAIWAIRVA